MKISETTFTVDHRGCLKIPSSVLKDMGITPGNHVRLAYLTDDGMRNTFQEFLIIPEGIQSYSEEQRIAIPAQLLQQSNIPMDADIQIICLDGILIIANEPGLDEAELASVLDGLRTADDMISKLHFGSETAWKDFRDFIDDREGELTYGELSGE